MEPAQKGTMKCVVSLIRKVFTDTIKKQFNVDEEAVVLPLSNIPGADYQIPTGKKLFHRYKKSHNSFGFATEADLTKTLVEKLEPNDVIENVEINSQGFIAARVSRKFIEDEITSLLKNGIVYKAEKSQVIPIDFLLSKHRQGDARRSPPLDHHRRVSFSFIGVPRS